MPRSRRFASVAVGMGSRYAELMDASFSHCPRRCASAGPGVARVTAESGSEHAFPPPASALELLATARPSTSWSSAAASPASGSRSTPRPVGCAPRLIERHDLASGTSSKIVEARARRDPLPPAARGRPRLRSARRAPGAAQQRAAPRARPAVPAPGVHPRRPAPPPPGPAARHARCGPTTSPAGSASASSTSGSRRRRRSRYMPTLHADRVAASYVYYDAQTDDARLTLAVARTAADYGAAIANYTSSSSSTRARRPRAHGVARRRRRQTIDRARARLVVNATGVWADDVRALDEGTHPSSIRPAKGVHITVPWSMVQNRDRRRDPGSEGSALGVRGSVGRRSRRPQVHLHRHDRHRLRRRRSTIRRSRPTTSSTCCARSTPRSPRRSPRPTSSVRGPACARSCAPATQRAHRRPVPPALGARSPSGVITVTGGKLTTYRRMAADAVDVAIEAARRQGPAQSRTKQVRLRGAAAGTSPDLPDRAGDALRQRRAARCWRSRAADPTLAEPIVPGLALHQSRGRVRGARGDGPHRRRRARPAAPVPGCSRATRRRPPPPRSPS